MTYAINPVVQTAQLQMPRFRNLWLDALRGIAVLWMTAFHFAFDLNYFGFIHQDFYSAPKWTVQRTCILSLFLLCAGAGQAIALHNDQNNGQSGATFWRRWCQIAGCAVLVSIGSSYMFPGSWIYFGVLHGIATMLLVCRLTASWGRWLWLAGAAAALVGVMAPQIHAQARDFWPGSEILNGYMLNWLGLVSRKPITEDYVPLLPWMGVMWWGMAGARWVLARGGLGLFGKTPAPAILHAAPGLPALAWIGRWSLTWYMLHQPLLIGLLTVVKAL